MINSYLILLIIPVLIAIICTPLVIKLAYQIGAIDQPDERKVHTKPMPRLGGLSIFISFFVTFGIGVWLFPDLFHQTSWLSWKSLILGISMLGILLLGIWDDITPIRPGRKFMIQFLIATAIYYSGIKISTVIDPFSGGIMQVGFVEYPLTILWIIGVTNAFNLIDGLDGLASGVALISILSIMSIAFLNTDLWTILVTLILAGSLIGFLFYNFNPAKIFLGDSGSLFLGFALSIISIQSFTKITTAFAIVIPILVMGLPIIDTFIAMLRRLLRSYLDDQVQNSSISLKRRLHSIFLPDRSHIHHQLISKGLSQRTAVIILYMISLFLGAGGLLIFYLGATEEAFVILVLILALIIFGIQKLQYQEMALLRNGIILGAYKRILSEQPYKLAIFDLFFIIISFTVSQYMVNRLDYTALLNANFNESLLLTVLIQMTVFALFGIYRETKYPANITNVVHILKTVFLAVFATVVLLTLYQDEWTNLSVLFYVVDFYLLVTFILGHRVLFHILNYFYMRYQTEASPVLIYGATEQSILAVYHLLNNSHALFQPIGYLDDDPSLEGRFFNGYPVFGGHWKLERLIRKQSIPNILITSSEMKAEIFRRIQRIAIKNKIRLLKMNYSPNGFQLETLALPYNNGSASENEFPTIREA